tara:strand:- start:91 stop:654 length:564 start_codon:yes stop_codon:yes gene_type:complete
MKVISLLIYLLLILSSQILAKETWILDKDLSTIEFELPLLLAHNVKGEFTEIYGLVEIDLITKKNNKGIFSVDIKSIDMNYKKYKKLLLSDIFFNTRDFPKALIDTKKFSYKNQNKLDLNVELTIKGITNNVPFSLEIIRLAEELVQLKGKLKFSRTAFKVGVGKWENTSILKDKANIDVNLFLFRK